MYYILNHVACEVKIDINFAKIAKGDLMKDTVRL